MGDLKEGVEFLWSELKPLGFIIIFPFWFMGWCFARFINTFIKRN